MNAPSRYARDEGIVVKKMEFGEMDLILTLFTRRRGKFQVIAKGARKLGNRFGGALDFFQVCEFFLYTASGMTNLVQAKIQRSFRNLLTRRETWVSGEYLLYLVDKVFEFEKPEDAVLNELLSLWENMLVLRHRHLQSYLLTLRFRAVLALFLGITPQLGRCVCCGRQCLGEESFLDFGRGGKVCRECGKESEPKLSLSPFLGAALGYIFSSSREAILKLRLATEQFCELDEVLSRYLSHHLEKTVLPLSHFLKKWGETLDVL